MIPDEEILTIYLFYVEKVFLDLPFCLFMSDRKKLLNLHVIVKDTLELNLVVWTR